jgi:outer membrane protein
MPAMAAADPVDPPERGLGSVIVRARVVGVVPQDTASTITRLGGKWASTAEAGGDLDVSVFLTSHLAIALGASTSRHAFQLDNTAFGTVPVGNARLIVPSLMLQYHFAPGWGVHPYLGAGPSAAVLIDPKPGGTLVDQLYFDSKVGVAFQAGIDIDVGPFVLNADVKQLLVRTTAFSPHPGRIPVKAQVQFNPTVFGLGLGVRF